MMIGSFLTIDELGCFNSSDSRVEANADELSQAIKWKYFDAFNGGYRLKRDRFVEAIKSSQVKSTPSMRTEPNQLDEDEYLDADLLTLTKFLSKNAVDLQCLENVPAERITHLIVNPKLLLYYDDDFFDRSAVVDYKLYNRLNLNPNLRLLIGTLKVSSYPEASVKQSMLASNLNNSNLFYHQNEECNSIHWFNDKYYTDQFNAPVMPKEAAKEFIRNFRSPFRGELSDDQ